VVQHVLHDGWVVDDDETHPWLLIAYNTPKQPSTARVTAWRRLHRLGALYIGPSTCLLPAGLADERALATVAEGITAAGGGIDTFRIEVFAAETHDTLIQRFNAERDAEYAEVVDRAQALVAELEREAERGKFNFAEVEENDADLAKLRRWLEAIAGRDRYGAAEGRAGAEQAVVAADQALQAFTERSADAEHEGRPGELR
jgi:hypothetical protein